MTKAFYISSRSVLIAVCALVSSSICAGPVSETAARLKAQAFMQERRPQAALTLQRAPLDSVGRQRAMKVPAQGAAPRQAPLHVFNVGSEQGFVIVSGDDRTPAILGYADSGSLSEGAMPDGLSYLLDGYAAQIASIDAQMSQQPQMSQMSQQSQQSQQPRKAVARTAIAPLIQTSWNQGAPYNALCPTKEDGTRTVTGCVATCMAQIMYYHRWPQAATTAIPGYSTRNKLFTLEGLEATTFSWDDMLPTYGSSATEGQEAAIARLMQYCGYGLQMSYNTISSAYSESIPEVLRLYFGYSNDADYVKRDAYSYTEWIDLLYGELYNRRPVALGGQSCGGGHSFICDGYEGDDYFHINWGWGGTSDGYFRLTALNPEEQGLGGSSTLDGFSYGQDAVIGIHPAATGEATAVTRLVLEGLQFEASNATATKTVIRSSQEEDFSGIPLFFFLANMTPGKNTFTVAAQVTDTEGNVLQTVTLESTELDCFKYYTFTETASLGKGLADGTYRIYIVSRMGDATDWQPCYGAARLHYTAVIADNQLTLTTPALFTGDNPTLAGISTTPTAPTLGEEVSVTATLTGGSSDYRGDLLLYVNGKKVMGKQADIPAGETVNVHFTYTPSTAGDNTLAIYADKTKLGNEATVNITDDGSTMALTLGIAATVSNTYQDGEDTYYYGNGIRATITVTNSSTEHDYRGTVNCSVRTWDGDNYIGNATSYDVTVPKNDGTADGVTQIPIAVDGLTAGNVYNLRITYYTVEDGKKKLAGNELQTDRLTMGSGYTLMAADGSTTLHPADDTIDAGNACFVNMSGMSLTKGTIVTPSTNPNCLYYLAEDADTPTALTGKNVVKGTTAEKLTLTDGHDFFTPIAFTATKATYTRTFTRAATTDGGWNGLYLPFDVTAVACGEKAIDWFHSDDDTGKHFWLKTMTGDDEGTLYFDHADALKANTPYIIALPGEDFGEWQLTGKAITFSGTDAAISATATALVSGNDYKFCGGTLAQEHADAYMLNTKGTRFIRGTATLPAFRAWIEAADISSLSRSTLLIGEGAIQGIEETEKAAKEGNDGTLYTLDGRKTNTKTAHKKGLYIQNGKKIIVR